MNIGFFGKRRKKKQYFFPLILSSVTLFFFFASLSDLFFNLINRKDIFISFYLSEGSELYLVSIILLISAIIRYILGNEEKRKELVDKYESNDDIKIFIYKRLVTLFIIISFLSLPILRFSLGRYEV